MANELRVDRKSTFNIRHSRDFYRGKSFYFAGEWKPGCHYIEDDYISQFITYKHTLLKCAKSHFSSAINEPTDLIYDETGTCIGIDSTYWEFVLSGVMGDTVKENIIAILGYTPADQADMDLKVDKVQGYGLSSNDYTTEEKQKLASLSPSQGSESAIETIKVNGTTIIPVNKTVDISVPTTLSGLSSDTTHRTVTDSEKNTWNEKQNTISDLNTIRSGAALGATALQSFTETDPTVPSWAKAQNKPSYTVQEVGALPNDTQIPSNLSELSDDANHRLVSDTEKSTWTGKQSLLVSGQNIKTINNQSILGSGNIQISTSGTIDSNLSLTSENPVQNKVITQAINDKYSKPQTGIPSTDLDTTTQTNLGKAATAIQSSDLATVATSGSYTDLNNRPSIPAAQVNSDWNATSGVAEILHKPTIPDAQIQSDWNQSDNTKKDFIKNKPSIPAAQVNADWNAVSGVAEILNKPTIPVIPTNVSAFNNDVGYLTTHQDVSGKADKVSGGTSGNFAGIDNSGNLIDSGCKASDFLTQHQDISGKENKVTVNTNPTVSGTLELADNTEYRFTNTTATLAVNTPSSYPDDYISLLVFVSGSTATSFTYPSTWKWSGDDVSGGLFVPAASKTYNICVWYDGININAISRGIWNN